MSNSPLINCTRISPNRTSPRKNPIDTITIHCVEGQCTAERLGEIFANPSRQASSNYGVGRDGRIGLYVEESDRSWCTGTGNDKDTNDHRAITIEVASDTIAPYAVNELAYQSMITLCVDICKRNGKKSLVFLGSKEATTAEWAKGKTDVMYLTAHKWYKSTSCPGEFLYSRFPSIAEQVTKLLTEEPKPTTPTITFPVIAVQKGSKGDDALRVQTILKGLGYYTGILDGDAGQMTHDSIVRYQQAENLYVDGIFGVKCWEHWLGI